jgi:hypothetical protein
MGAELALSAADACGPELVALILTGNVGVSTFVQASMVSKTWRAACRENEPLLRAVALYTAGLTTTHFCGLFGLTTKEACQFAHEWRGGLGGGSYRLFGGGAVLTVMKCMGGLAGWRTRIARAPAARATPPLSTGGARICGNKRLRQWQLEERYRVVRHAMNVS